MSTFQSPRIGPPTFTAASASLSLSGLDSTPLPESDLMDTDWYGQHDYGHPRLHAQPALSPLDELVGSAGFAFSAHAELASGDAFAVSHLSPGDVSMNGHAYPPYPTAAPRLDDLTPISPIQPHYNLNAFQDPYPDSTASSAPSDDPVVADAEEDKRRRNQAASARFRQKKKQREAQMLELSRDAVEKNKKLEGELEGLKRENTFLRRLLVEKIDNMSDEDKALLVKTRNDAAKGET